jgi:hypothetical protein
MFTYTDFTHPSLWAPSDGNASPRFENIDFVAPIKPARVRGSSKKLTANPDYSLNKL